MIYLIRHGQASFLKSDYDQLSELGQQQSEVLGNALKDRNQEASFISRGSLNRHEQTARHCLNAFGIDKDVSEDDRWNEYDHMELLSKHNPAFTDYAAIGEYLMNQENPMKALQQVLNKSIGDWIKGAYDYHTSWEDFKKGVLDALNDVASKLDKGQSAWVFTSGGPISVALIELLALKDEQFVDLQARLVNSSITKILVGKNRLSLSSYNDYGHLDHNPNFITYR
ncbi:histidine phosphatase family protein [Ekhidna sp.]